MKNIIIWNYVNFKPKVTHKETYGQCIMEKINEQVNTVVVLRENTTYEYTVFSRIFFFFYCAYKGLLHSIEELLLDS